MPRTVPPDLDYGAIPGDCVCGGCEARRYGPPDCRYRAFLDGIVLRVARNPLADRIRLFGSVTTLKPRPGDVDCCVDLDEPVWAGGVGAPARALGEGLDEATRRALGHLLAVARAAYGSVDPFVRHHGALWVRSDEATGWIRAANARLIWAAVRDHGVAVRDHRPRTPTAAATA